MLESTNQGSKLVLQNNRFIQYNMFTLRNEWIICSDCDMHNIITIIV